MTETGSDGPYTPDALRDTARQHEPDRYLAALLAPRSVREDLVTLAAFGAEMLRVPTLVREPMVGEIRLQWWRDALDAPEQRERTGNPLADRLRTAMQRHGLSPALLEAPIEASSHVLHVAAGAAADTGDSAAGAEAALFTAALLVLGCPLTPAAEETAHEAGLAYAISRGRFEREAPGHVDKSAQQARVERARTALAAARRGADALGGAALPAFLPLVMVEPYLRVLEQRDAGRFAHVVEVAPLRRVWRLWRASRRRRF